MKLRHTLSAFAFITAGLALTTAAMADATVSAHAQTEHVAPHADEPRPIEYADAEHDERGELEHGPGEHGEAERTAHGNHHAPEAVNWTDIADKKRPAIIALLINFGLLAALYYTLGKKPVAEGLKERRIKIGKDIEDARKALAEAEERAKKYQGDLKNADADAETARTALVAAGKGDAERVLREANERAERMQRDATKLVEQERKSVEQELHGQTVELALASAQQLLEKSVTAEDHARLAGDLLAELARRPAASVRTTGGAS